MNATDAGLLLRKIITTLLFDQYGTVVRRISACPGCRRGHRTMSASGVATDDTRRTAKGWFDSRSSRSLATPMRSWHASVWRRARESDTTGMPEGTHQG